VLEQRAEFGKRVVRKVPVEWIGVASEVKVMGDFDDWTRGHELSAEDVASDSVYSRWVAMSVGLWGWARHAAVAKELLRGFSVRTGTGLREGCGRCTVCLKFWRKKAWAGS
jgi:hypothetical protein